MIRRGAKGRPYLSARLRIRWQSPRLTREAFFETNRLVVAIPRDFDRDDAIIDLVFLFVSRSLLVQIKRYLVDAQREALNIYYTNRLLRATSTRLSEQFVEDFQPAALSDVTGRYLAAFDMLERYALFEDLMIPELEILGAKLATSSAAPQLSKDVAALTDKLVEIAQRGPGEDIDLVLERAYVRCAVMLVGRREKLRSGIDPYLQFIRHQLVPRQIDSVYMLSDNKKRKDVDGIAAGMRADYQLRRSISRRAILLGRAGDVYLVQLGALHASATTSGILFAREGVRFSEDQAPEAAIDPRSSNTKITGTIKFVSDEGWGFIALDDPSFYRQDAWFSLRSVYWQPAVIGSGDRVEFRVTRDDQGRLNASEIRVLLAESDSESWERVEPEQAHQQIHLDGSASTETLEGFTIWLRSVVNELQQRRNGSVDLAHLGSVIRQRLPDFDYANYGAATLLDLVESCRESDPTLVIERSESGHPRLSLRNPTEIERSHGERGATS